mgnify:CR=1 FL=1
MGVAAGEREHRGRKKVARGQRPGCGRDRCVGDAIGDGSGSGQHESRMAETTAMWQWRLMCCSTNSDRNRTMGRDLDMGTNGVWAMRLVTAVAVGSMNH